MELTSVVSLVGRCSGICGIAISLLLAVAPSGLSDSAWDDDRCELRLVVVADLTAESLPGPPISAIATGEQVILAAFPIGVVLRFALTPSGVEVESFERRGQGPGEFTMPLRLVDGSGGSFYLFDGANRRLTLFDSEFEPSSSFRMRAAPFSAVSLQAGLVVNANARTPESIGFPLHWVGRSGDLLQSFGPERRRVHPNDPPTWRRSLLAAGESVVWEARDFWYELRKWRLVDGDGWREDAFFDLKSDAFPAPESLEASREHPPLPFVVGLSWLEGFLLVTIKTPSPRWPDAFTGPDGTDRASPRLDLLHHARFELVHPETGRVVSHLEAPVNVEQALSDGRILAYTEERLVPELTLLRVTASGCEGAR